MSFTTSTVAFLVTIDFCQSLSTTCFCFPRHYNGIIIELTMTSPPKRIGRGLHNSRFVMWSKSVLLIGWGPNFHIMSESVHGTVFYVNQIIRRIYKTCYMIHKQLRHWPTCNLTTLSVKVNLNNLMLLIATSLAPKIDRYSPPLSSVLLIHTYVLLAIDMYPCIRFE